MRELILDPAGMKDSTFEQPLPPERAARAANAHPWNGVLQYKVVGMSIQKWRLLAFGPRQVIWPVSEAESCGLSVARSSALGLKQETVMEMLRPNYQIKRLAKISLAWLGLRRCEIEESGLAMVGRG